MDTTNGEMGIGHYFLICSCFQDFPTYLKAGSAAIAAGGAPEYVAYVAGQAEFCSRH